MPRKLGIVIVLLAVSLGGAVRPADARDQGSMGVMTPQMQHIKKDFLPIPGVYPQENPAAQAFAFYRPFGCGAVTYCDRITFRVRYPEDYLLSLRGTEYVSFGIKVTLTWPNKDANDLDLFVWPDDDPTSGGPQGPCGSPLDEECQKLYPEEFDVVEPSPPDDDPATDEDESKNPIEIYMSVVNHSGLNQGYTIDLRWHLIELGDLPEFKREDFKTSRFSPTSTPRAASTDRSAEDDLPTPAAPTRTVLVPGPDGKLVERELPVFAAGNRFEESKGGVPLLPIGIGVAVVGGSVVALLIVRRRRLEGA